MLGVDYSRFAVIGYPVMHEKLASLLLGSMLILPLSLVLLVSWVGHGFNFMGSSISGADIAAWPYSVGILCKFTAFLGTLHWPMGSDDMGHFGVSFLELLVLFEQWAGHRLLSDKVTRPHVRFGSVLFWFPLFLCLKELKFDMVVSSSAVWLER